ncbi:OsmC family protein [Terrihabitans sp. B22-R8]|uniref:OsmC family protein n=1 Tax=Terrihabitans sp. B22-R8 TaxID=3425128 RepID=UPI00403C61D0
MADDLPAVTITQTSDYQFLVDFGSGFPQITADEPPPHGRGEGPRPEQLLTASVANCLCASLFFALTKSGQDAKGVSARTTYQTGRNADGRLRVTGIDVDMAVGAVAGDWDGAADRALQRFENICTVTESVKQGIPVRVSLTDGNGEAVKIGQPVATVAGADTARGSGAQHPAELIRLFVRHANAGDVDGLVGLYEPDAVLAVGGPVAKGHDQIRAFYTDLLAKKSSFKPVEPLHTIEAGDVALTVVKLRETKFSTEVARRQADGQWLWAIDELKVDLDA